VSKIFERKGPVPADRARCAQLLPSVSRTFAITIRVLPGSLRDAVTIAYLLCRIADVFEDSNRIDPRTRKGKLLSMAEAFAAITDRSDDAEGDGHERDRRARERLLSCLDDCDAWPDMDEASRALLESGEAVVRAFHSLPPITRGIIAHWVEAMARGMAGFVERELEPQSADGLLFKLHTWEEMRSYAYCVAGTVGYLLTELFTHDLRLGDTQKTARLRDLAGSFGLGLQLTNILQDLSEDRVRGWSYIPEELATRHGTTIARLQQESDRAAALRVIADLIEEAAAHLDAAMEFTLLIPRHAPRIRLFCLWPIFFARRTLVKLWGEPAVLDGGEKVRISRSEVRSLMRQTISGCLSDRRLLQLYENERGRLRERMAVRPV
jgi:farnesyl-diphosphate farnesyltransferase